MRILINLAIVLIPVFFFSCNKNHPYIEKSIISFAEGRVLMDCSGNSAKGIKVYVTTNTVGCFGGGVYAVDSARTDSNGYYRVPFKQNLGDGNFSTSGYAYSLTIPGSYIDVTPFNYYDLYPNDSIMTAVIKMHFPQSYTVLDTFYYQYRPTHNWRNHEPSLTGYFTGPFHDTTLVLTGLVVGNTNDQDHGELNSGMFKWGIGKKNLNTNFSGRDGSFYFKHTPCAVADTVEYYVNPATI